MINGKYNHKYLVTAVRQDHQTKHWYFWNLKLVSLRTRQSYCVKLDQNTQKKDSI